MNKCMKWGETQTAVCRRLLARFFPKKNLEATNEITGSKGQAWKASRIRLCKWLPIQNWSLKHLRHVRAEFSPQSREVEADTNFKTKQASGDPYPYMLKCVFRTMNKLVERIINSRPTKIRKKGETSNSERCIRRINTASTNFKVRNWGR